METTQVPSTTGSVRRPLGKGYGSLRIGTTAPSTALKNYASAQETKDWCKSRNQAWDTYETAARTLGKQLDKKYPAFKRALELADPEESTLEPSVTFAIQSEFTYDKDDPVKSLLAQYQSQTQRGMASGYLVAVDDNGQESVVRSDPVTLILDDGDAWQVPENFDHKRTEAWIKAVSGL